jgi:hyperosmotically inducible protein
MLNKTMRRFCLAAGIILLTSLAPVSKASIPATSASTSVADSLQSRIQHELRMLPYYGVFDDIGFTVEGTTVTLSGEVRRPILKADAEHAVAGVAGVEKVINNIEVLPVSTADEFLRQRMYRAIYSQPGFEKYATQALKPIRIIVRNGDVRLVGVVGSELDKKLAGSAARNVPFAFSVTNNLTVG